MEKGMIFWGLMIAWLLLGLFIRWGSPPALLVHGSDLLLFILLGLLGWKVFGPAVK